MFKFEYLFVNLILSKLKGLFGYYFIKVNIFWCRLRRSTWLGKYPITEVLREFILFDQYFHFLNSLLFII